MKYLCRLFAVAAVSFSANTSFAQTAPCGGDFNAFMQQVGQEARAQGLPQNAINAVISAARQDPKVLRFDRAQGVFRQTFLEFSQRSISGSRLRIGAQKLDQYASVFNRAEREYGVPPEVILAFWALETDYGAVQGDFNTVSALATLAHDCRRPDLFRPELFAAIALTAQGDIDPARTTGAWAGEIGMVQMLPEDILTKGVDGDGDGQVSLKTSAPDAIMTAASLVAELGWRAGEPWLVEVTVPDNFPWAESGLANKKSVREWAQLGVAARGQMPSRRLEASVFAPQGRRGPVFMALPNYAVYQEWNHSFVYQATVSYMATRIGGAQRYVQTTPEQGLSGDQMKRLQRVLQNRGYDVGGADGILGAKTRTAVQAEQVRLGISADGWPTPALLARY
ncbi:MAG TPA: lytic murein transglycosylase [Rhodobacteraceae bacterium]|nr:lytic murein transglycosylase [Paracoccaceae bacterium]